MNILAITFGELIRDIRMREGITLREACRHTSTDPSNWSKIERGLMSPPSDSVTLENWARVLKIKKTSDEWRKFFELAEIAHGEIPKDILSSINVQLLPAFFRTVRGKKPTEEELKKLIDLIKKA